MSNNNFNFNLSAGWGENACGFEHDQILKELDMEVIDYRKCVEKSKRAGKFEAWDDEKQICENKTTIGQYLIDYTNFCAMGGEYHTILF